MSNIERMVELTTPYPSINLRPLTFDECFNAAVAWEALLFDARNQGRPTILAIIAETRDEWLQRALNAEQHDGWDIPGPTGTWRLCHCGRPFDYVREDHCESCGCEHFEMPRCAS